MAMLTYNSYRTGRSKNGKASHRRENGDELTRGKIADQRAEQDGKRVTNEHR